MNLSAYWETLIRSFPDDVHADAVLWAFNLLGRRAFLWRSDVFPVHQRWSAEMASDGTCRHRVTIEDEPHDLPTVRTVWNRRALPPSLVEGLSEQDAKVAWEESRAHTRGLIRTLAPEAFWVNPPSVVESIQHKPVQIRLANRVGFRVPETLFSNDPDAIADFHRRHDSNIVYKCFYGNSWKLEDGSERIYAMNRTVPVLPEDLEHRAALSAAPGIFQRRIEKAFELRVTAMGRTLIAARIDSQKHEATREDWRSGQHLLEIEPFDLPEDVAGRCRRYMREAGLNFGCFDFIVTPEGDYYFLEVNQAGQFLWKEARCPDLPMLQAFCDFLVAADPDFLWQPRTPEVTFADYRASDAGRAFAARMDPRGSVKRFAAQG